MNAIKARAGAGKPKEPRWGRFIVLSMCFHLGVFSLFLFFPDAIPTRKITGAAVYEVNLVTLPAAKAKAAPAPAPAQKTSPVAVTREAKTTETKRISEPQVEEKEKPVIIGKRVVERKKKTPPKTQKKPKKKPRVSASRLIDQAVAKVKKEVRTQKRTEHHLDKALSKIEKRVADSNGNATGGGAPDGIAIRIYQMEVESLIKSNWQYPVALTSPEKRKDLESTVMLKVSHDGTIIKSWFAGRSNNVLFDDSVMKAVERSNPLPPFPEGYNKRQDELEIRFNLSELADV